MRSGKAKLLPFDPEAKQPKMSYKVRVLSFHHSQVVVRSLCKACIADMDVRPSVQQLI